MGGLIPNRGGKDIWHSILRVEALYSHFSLCFLPKPVAFTGLLFFSSDSSWLRLDTTHHRLAIS